MIYLKKGREKSLKRRHPWIFSGAIEKVTGKPGSGDTVEVRDSSAKPHALAAYSPKSQIRARVWSLVVSQPVDEKCIKKTLQHAIALRQKLPAAKHSNAMRLVHGESDGLPGLVVDRYADVLVAQFLSACVERWREPILDSLIEITGCEAIFERSDAEVRKLEGLEQRVGWARTAGGVAPAGRVNRDLGRCPIVEHRLNFPVPVEQGRNTGSFLHTPQNAPARRAPAPAAGAP